MKIHEFLTQNPKAWCQKTFARDREGKPCTAEDKVAVSWNLPSLLKRHYINYEETQKAYKMLLDHIGVTSLSIYNDRDDLTIDEVVRVLRILDL